MKVLHVYKLYSPVRGGGISAMESAIEGLREKVDSRVLVATAAGPGKQEPIGSATVRRVSSFGYVNSMPIAPTLPFWFLHESKQVDVVHLHLPFPIADLAVNLWRPSVPVVVHWHSDIVQQVNFKRLLRPVLRNTLKLADRIVIGSEQHLKSSEELTDFEDKCTVVPYGIDVEKWAIPAEDQKKVVELRMQYPRMVFFLGRLVAYKGLPVLIDAMAGIDAQLVIAGEGPMLPLLQKQVAELQIAQKVHFVGALSFQELRAYYHASTMFVLPSIYKNEAFGLSQLEAMACGKPVINTALPTGVPGVARDRKEGLTVPPGDSEALAGSIQELLGNPDLAESLGRAGYQRACTRFNQQIFSHNLHSLYDELLQQRSVAGDGINGRVGSMSDRYARENQ